MPERKPLGSQSTLEPAQEQFSCTTLDAHPCGAVVKRILGAALQAVEPGAAVARYLKRRGNNLIIAERTYHLADIDRVLVIGFGKAAAVMGQAAATILGDCLEAGLLITKEGHAKPPQGGFDPRLTLLEAGHPIPDARSVAASQRLIASLEDLTPRDLVLCLVSGGGSALLTAPAAGINLEDLQALTELLLACGANIFEINTLRKHLELLKGGGLVRVVAPAELAVLVLSDVIGDPLDVIASGPAVPDPTSFADALAVLERYSITSRTPNRILQHLESGARGSLPETPKPQDPVFAKVHTWIVGSNQQAAQAALQQARQEGLDARLLTSFLQGEARQAGRFLAALGIQLALGGGLVSIPGCLVAGGETTVTLIGDGLGGRNQELALGAVDDLAGMENVVLVTLATDGGDGPTDAAGAVVSGNTLARARSFGIEPHSALARNDAYHFFQALGDLLITGPTQTNVNDLAFLFAFQPSTKAVQS
jgi:hydroxypyruvate reductase